MVQTLQRLGLVPSDLAVSLQTLASHNSPVSEFLKIKVWDLTPSSQKPTRASKTGWASSWPCRAPDPRDKVNRFRRRIQASVAIRRFCGLPTVTVRFASRTRRRAFV